MTMSSNYACGLAVTIFVTWISSVSSANVSYDHRALLINGTRRFLQSASIHYPRSTPQMWPQLIDRAKLGGIDVIQTYVFWDIHEPERESYNFSGRLDLVQFVKVVAAAGLYVNLRIGPYVCAEWNFGGFPSWLRFIPGIEFRTDNEQFKEEMQRFVSKIVSMMKADQLFASQGGPIILAQIENEYGNIDSTFGPAASKYIQWAASMAEGLDTGVPWSMCQQSDAPGNIINTCNGFYCDSFTPNSPNKPKLWTENWTGWYHSWGTLHPHRPVEDIAFAVARFFEKGGSFQNYYMYHGGTNFERTAGEWITTSYDYDAPLDEYGQPRQPKWGHLKDLHAAIKSCEPALAVVDGDPFQISLGGDQEAHIYANGNGSTVRDIVSSSSICAAFLANWDNSSSSSTVQFNGQSYDLPSWSVSILPDCKSVTFNTAKVGSQTSLMKMMPTIANSKTAESNASGCQQPLQWQTYQEPVGAWGNGSTLSGGLLDQINVTKDSSDYLWYMTSVQVPVSGSCSGNIVINGVKDTLHLFVNGAYVGSPTSSFQGYYSQQVQLEQGNNTINILSLTLGLQDYGAWLERESTGIGQAQLSGLPNGNVNLTGQQWQYQVGMHGEQLRLFSETGANSVTWQTGKPPTNQSLVWYKTTVDVPAGEGPLALDLTSMGKGQAWINGHSLGRYWTIVQASLATLQNAFGETSLQNVHGGTSLQNVHGGTYSTACDYHGNYNPFKCATGWGEPSQRWYHVPRDWLQPTGNFLVIFEETGGDPCKISLTTQVLDTVCAHMSEVHPTPLESSGANPSWGSQPEKSKLPPKLELDCSSGHVISEVVFGSFGNPSGTCGSFQKGSCHADQSRDFLSQECVGKRQCSIQVSWTMFASSDPCPQESKSLAVEALCRAE